jgi:putative intracellular protease/amidase
MDTTRRALALAAATAAFAAPAVRAAEPTLSSPRPPAPRGPRPSTDPAYWLSPKGGETIAMLLYPGMTALDLIGPHYALATLKGAKVTLVSKTLAPVLADRGVTLTPTATFDEVPADLDVLFVPGGGFGTLTAMDDDATLAFLADRGARARYVTSVCTGALILGAAGLLDGYKATAHWKVRDAVLPSLGATPVNTRICEDRNRITGAGVTAGLDLGLHLAARLRGPDAARMVQLIAEYDPQPPFDSGTPERAWPETADLMRSLLPSYNADAIRIGERRRARTTS